MKEKVISIIKDIGYQYEEQDNFICDLVIENIINRIKAITNTNELNSDLDNIVCLRSVGEFLFVKKSSGKLKGFEFDNVIKQIQEGDTSVTFSIGSGSLTKEQRVDSLIDYLINYGSNEINSYRKIRW